jgi:hypothetical protein
MAQPSESRITFTLALDTEHWRRHDRAHWAQVLANAVHEAVPHVLQVEGYELSDTMMLVRARANQPAKTVLKLLRTDESFLRLRSRLADLGARADFEIEE